MSTKLCAIQALAIGLFFLVPLVVPIQVRAASSSLDEQVISLCGTIQIEQPFRRIQS
jgi:hypothetical protein